VKRIQIANLGPIRAADISLGDLTVLVGPQATGKSIFLQLLELLLDKPSIHAELRRFNIDWHGDLESFLELYFGEGMKGIWAPAASTLAIDGKADDLARYARGPNRSRDEVLFYIPAQRVMSLREGATRPFTDYRSGDPFVLREFSEKLHQLVQNELTPSGVLFPQRQRLYDALRRPLEEHLFGGFGLQMDAQKFQRRIVLREGTGEALPYLVWSAGQREFVPLLLGVYWLLPPAAISRRGAYRWVVIEELEMGLHPDAITAVLCLVMELLKRGYRVCLSTHSPHVLDVVWALRFLKSHGGELRDVLRLLKLRSTEPSKRLAQAALRKKYHVHYFQRGGTVRDISGLDPGASDEAEAGWGGLSGFSGHAGDVVAEVANRSQRSRSG